MKSTNYILLIVFVAALIVLPLRLNTSKFEESQYLKQVYTNITYNSVEDAGSVLLEPDDQISLDQIADGYSTPINKLTPNLDKATDRFYKTLFLNLGIANDKVMQDADKIYIPLKLVTAYDGYYINAWTDVVNNSNGKSSVKEAWQPKKAYSYTDNSNKLILNFTLDDYVKIYDISTGAWKEGKRGDLESQFPECSILKDQYFDSFRRQIIVNSITKDLQYYSSKNSELAKRYGLKYNFNIAYIQNDKRFNTINNICFIAFFQGLPVNGVNQEFSTFAVGASKVLEKKKYYGNLINGRLTYHEEGCADITPGSKVFDSKVEAAKNGYYPCNDCKP